MKNNFLSKTNLDRFMALNLFKAHLIPQNLETYLHQSGWEKGRTDLILQGNESIQTTQRGSI